MSRGTTLGLLFSLLALGCGRANDHAPDQLLRDSLGLLESDRVYRVELAADRSGETPSPSRVTVSAGAFVEFVTTDRRLHTVTFSLDEIDAPGTGFLRRTGQDASPPLVDLGSRFVVSFIHAPPGRYPYVVEGNGTSGRGEVVVEAADGG